MKFVKSSSKNEKAKILYCSNNKNFSNQNTFNSETYHTEYSNLISVTTCHTKYSKTHFSNIIEIKYFSRFIGNGMMLAVMA